MFSAARRSLLLRVAESRRSGPERTDRRADVLPSDTILASKSVRSASNTEGPCWPRRLRERQLVPLFCEGPPLTLLQGPKYPRRVRGGTRPLAPQSGKNVRM